MVYEGSYISDEKGICIGNLKASRRRSLVQMKSIVDFLEDLHENWNRFRYEFVFKEMSLWISCIMSDRFKINNTHHFLQVRTRKLYPDPMMANAKIGPRKAKEWCIRIQSIYRSGVACLCICIYYE